MYSWQGGHRTVEKPSAEQPVGSSGGGRMISFWERLRVLDDFEYDVYIWTLMV